MKELLAPRAETYAYLLYDNSKHKKTKDTKKCVIKRTLENNTDCLLNDKIILKSQQRFRSDYHNVYTEQISKIALCSNDVK